MRFAKIIINLLIVLTLFFILYPHVKSYKSDKINEIKIKRYFDDNKYNYFDEYKAVLKIPSINFLRGLYDINNPLNDISKNIAFLENTSYPNNNSNTVIIGHSGDSLISYFKDLNKLKIGDLIYFYYDNFEYIFEVADIYIVDKTGFVEVKRNKNKMTLTLITCYLDKYQLVIVAYKK